MSRENRSELRLRDARDQERADQARSRGSRWWPTSAACASVVGTLEITSKPTKTARTKTVSSRSSCVAHCLASRRRECGQRRLVQDLALVGERRAFDDLVVEVERQRAVFDQELQQRVDVARVELAGVVGIVDGRLVRTDDRHAVVHDRLAGLGAVRSFRPSSAARSTMTEPGFMPLHRLLGDQDRRAASGDELPW